VSIDTGRSWEQQQAEAIGQLRALPAGAAFYVAVADETAARGMRVTAEPGLDDCSAWCRRVELFAREISELPDLDERGRPA
jgi:hypothetical protein